MGLVDLKTDLKSLKFGNDRIYGGNSKQPYIQTPIPERVGEFGFLNKDFILRGGTKAVTDSALDVVRLGKYFLDIRNPSGLFFIAKQNLLSRTAVRTQASRSRLLNEGVYTPLSTLIQAGGNAFGIHVNKQGLNPFDGPGSLTTYNEVKSRVTELRTNRLVDLYDKNQNPDSKSFRLDPVNILTYTGGPGSILGIGKTRIKFADQRTGKASGKDLKYYQTGLNYSDTDRSDLVDKIEANSKSFTPASFDFMRTNKIIISLPELTYSQGNTYYAISSQTNSQTGRNNPLFKVAPSFFYGESHPLLSTYFTTKGEYEAIPSDPNENIIRYVGASDRYGNVFTDYKGGKLIGTSNLVDTITTTNYSILSTPIPDVFLFNDNDIRISILPPEDFEKASRNYNTFIGEGTDLTKNLLEISSFIDSVNGSRSNWYPTIGGGGLGYSKVGIGGVLTNYPQDFQTPPNIYGNTTENVTGDNATYTRKDIISSSLYSTTLVVQDFREILRKKIDDNLTVPGSLNNAWNILSTSPDYSKKNIETRVKLGDPGNPNQKNLKSYVNGGYKGAASKESYDKINASKIYKSSSPKESKFNDLVKFRIGVLDNTAPTSKTYIHFRAFLDQISDSFTSDWNDTQYIGRGEKFYTYSGFTRKVSLSWTVAAQSKVELIPMYKRLNYLASICTPDYSGTGYMRGNIVTLTIGGYFYEQPGIITGFSYEMNDENATWEIGIPDSNDASPFYDSSVKELPHRIKVSGFNFIPIHTFVPRLVQEIESGTEERYIALANGIGLSSTNYK